MTRYTSEINKQCLYLNHSTIVDLYKSIRISTRFRFELYFLDGQYGIFPIYLTAKYFDYFDEDEKIYRYYIITNEKRKALVKHLEIYDHSLRQISNKECFDHLEKKGYRQKQIHNTLTVNSLPDFKMMDQSCNFDNSHNSDKSTNKRSNWLDESNSIYHLNGIDYKILGMRNDSTTRNFLVTSEIKQVCLSEINHLVKSIKFRGYESIHKIPIGKRAEDQNSIIYKCVMANFGKLPLWDNTILVDLHKFPDNEIMMYLNINNHTLLDIEIINVIRELEGLAVLAFT